jgi:hypothetical protein
MMRRFIRRYWEYQRRRAEGCGRRRAGRSSPPLPPTPPHHDPGQGYHWGWDVLAVVVLGMIVAGVVGLLIMLCASLCRGAPLPASVLNANARSMEDDYRAEYAPVPPPGWVIRDLRVFPPREVVRSWVRFQKARGAHLEGLLRLRPQDVAVQDTLDRQWRLYSVWSLLKESQDPACGGAYRAGCMTKLRGKIGRVSYAAGRMPPAVEWWTFDRAD